MNLIFSREEARKIFKNDWFLLISLSFLSLFLEVTLIRHLASEIRIFAYFKNLTLIGAFLGLGVGYLYKPRLSMLVTIGCVSLLAVFSNHASGFYAISSFLNIGDFNIWENPEKKLWMIVVGLVMLSIIFVLIFVSMIPVGQGLAEIFDRSEKRIRDYSINILGSLLGVWFFAWLSFDRLPPVVWYIAVIGMVFAIYSWNAKKSIIIGALSIVTLVSLTITNSGQTPLATIWSPYQKITLSKHIYNYTVDNEKNLNSIDHYQISTNDTVYLYLLNLGDKLRQQHPVIFPPKHNNHFYYDIPYNFPEKLDDVLILGSGGGNDVAAALRAGAKHVTAVEIDPAILDIGKKYHPENPYGSDRVTIVNNDARNFLRNTENKYDLIVLGLLDSHTLTSNFSNTNLDSFMYTVESVRDMKNLLKSDGTLALSFQVNYLWVGAKIYNMMNDIFGAPPLTLDMRAKEKEFIKGTGGVYFINSINRDLMAKRISSDDIMRLLQSRSENLINEFRQENVETQTDDWPYLYIQSRKIPALHILVSALLISIFAAVYARNFGMPERSDIHFAALGAGFLLLEVSIISRFALFWGTTWIVSSIVISIILIAILLANSIFIKNGAFNYRTIYALLAVSLVALYFVPLESNSVIVLYVFPFILIGYIFAKSFNSAPDASRALAYNLFGALAGGLSESFSFLIGLSGLIFVALALYAVSFVTLKK